MKPIRERSDRGILHAEAGRRRFDLTRYEPSAELAPFVEHYWMVEWDLRGHEPYTQVILSYPNVQLVFEKEPSGLCAGLYGVPSCAYTRILADTGSAFGVKFKPGGFYPFRRQPVSALTGTSVPAGELFGEDALEVQRRVFEEEDGPQRAAIVEAFLQERLPSRDENAELAAAVVEAAMAERDISRVEDLADRFGLSVRALQRLFSRYVGVSPKWVICRFRLQEAAEKMEQGDFPDWARLSADLGYYDQAHFIKDFKALVGKPPEEYVRESGRRDP